MLFIDRIKSRPLVIGLTILHIAFITYMDYLTGSEFSFSIFYVIAIAMTAVSKTSNKTIIIGASIFAAACYYYVDAISTDYSHVLFPIWNAFVRLAIFMSIGLLVHSFRKKHDTLNAINTKLSHLNNEKNKFIGMAAHDIRNPISGIFSFSNLLLDDKDSKMNNEESEIVNHIKSLSQNILDLIKQLLDVSKIESGQIDLQVQNQDYIKFIKEQVHFNQLLAKPKHISIHLDVNEEQLLAAFDAHYFSEVINNLLSNAIKFSEKNSKIILKISVDNEFILTEIIDQGKGIPEAEQNKLFNYFQKTSTKPTDGESSTGLGLAIVKKIVIACNGTIGMKSNLNEGSNFYFTFPVKTV